jgi:hypothetical protein
MTKFDIAYSIRGTTFHGQKQITVQFEDFRVVEEQPVEIRSSKIDIQDMRFKSSSKIPAPFALVWAEAAEKSKGKSRYELYPAKELAIYTTPPSPLELRKALELVKPETVYVYAFSPGEEKPDDYLYRLAGLCKYALNNRGGKAAISELTIAMASRESAVQIGLEWLASGGQLTISFDEDDIMITSEKQKKDPYLQSELFIALKGILLETTAYRKYWQTIQDVKKLIAP